MAVFGTQWLYFIQFRFNLVGSWCWSQVQWCLWDSMSWQWSCMYASSVGGCVWSCMWEGSNNWSVDVWSSNVWAGNVWDSNVISIRNCWGMSVVSISWVWWVLCDWSMRICWVSPWCCWCVWPYCWAWGASDEKSD